MTGKRLDQPSLASNLEEGARVQEYEQFLEAGKGEGMILPRASRRGAAPPTGAFDPRETHVSLSPPEVTK